MKRPLVVAAAALAVAFTQPAQAEDEPRGERAPRVGLAAEVDPVPFVLRGWAANVSYRIADGVTVGAAAFAFDVPGPIRPIALDPSSSESDLRLKAGASLFVHRYLFRRDDGFYVGLQVGFSNFRVGDDRPEGGTASYTTGLVMPRAGYKWFLGSTGLYLLPWAGVAFLPMDRATRPVGAFNYTSRPVLPFGAVHLGFEL